MKYLQIDTNIFIKYDEEVKIAEVISKSELKDQIDNLKKNLPKVPNDKELLVWAKKNYPGLENIDEELKRIDLLEKELAQLNDTKVL